MTDRAQHTVEHSATPRRAASVTSFMSDCIGVKMVSDVNSCSLWVLGAGMSHSLVYTFWDIFTMSVHDFYNQKKE